MREADCHVLVNSRDTETIWMFLDTFLPQRECSIAGWLVEEGTEHEKEITDVEELIEFCIKHPTEPQSIYWRGLNEYSRRHVWVFFTDDSATIYGLMCFDEDDTQENELLERMQKHFGSNIGYVSYVEPPPNSASQYTAIFKSISIHGEPT